MKFFKRANDFSAISPITTFVLCQKLCSLRLLLNVAAVLGGGYAGAAAELPHKMRVVLKAAKLRYPSDRKRGVREVIFRALQPRREHVLVTAYAELPFV